MCPSSRTSLGKSGTQRYPWCTAAVVSDRVGRKPLIYMSCTVMGSMYIGYIFAQSFTAVLLLGVVYVSALVLHLLAALDISPALTSLRRAQGASNGVYLAVDYALAVECLPNPDDKAKDLLKESLGNDVRPRACHGSPSRFPPPRYTTTRCVRRSTCIL